jgi:undecaprenyl-diphosphatase
MPRITHMGGASFTVLTCLFLYLFGQSEAKIAATEAFVTITGSQGIVQLFKNTITRKRPYLVMPEVHTFWRKLLKDCSFPSGHTTAGFSLAAILAIHFPAYSLVSYFLATMVGVSRSIYRHALSFGCTKRCFFRNRVCYFNTNYKKG